MSELKAIDLLRQDYEDVFSLGFISSAMCMCNENVKCVHVLNSHLEIFLFIRDGFVQSDPRRKSCSCM